MTAEFARARSDEQRAMRRRAILATAAEVLGDGTRVADLSLNALARRVGLAKSNVLRYFETREAVLLALLDAEYGSWLDEVEGELVQSDAPADTASQLERIADVISRTIAARPMLAELVATSAVVLEHNVSAEIAADYKRRAYAQAMRLVGLVEARLGELPDASRIALAASVNLAIGGAWGMCRPSPGMAEAYARDPELAAMQLDYRVAVRELVATALTGLLARSVAPWQQNGTSTTRSRP
ncbi:TetR/AcrR family transcriptional regulator [Gryllotalpicola protaetiae]|uniref:TetR/AcrR family transcriptional regulator n=1 Tax=Gryllotalpicola protaetiae TaxID=2419771 RepID=A0A387BNJ5_9MICO|nr:TetR family transcriptional regulator [Gryllotalpicola protaetiae]AYG02567.1 TetR/AcrR family transcriptional regulator [Gryllotalpicola protaetiae]